MKNYFRHKKNLGSIMVITFSLSPILILFFVQSGQVITTLKNRLSSPSSTKSSIQRKTNNSDFFEKESFGMIPLDTVSEVVSAKEGGKLALKDNSLSMAIPPGALDKDKNLSITRVSVLNQQGNTSDYVYKCEPEGLKFKKSIEMNFAIPYKYDPQIIEVVYLDSNSQSWISDVRQNIFPDQERIISRPKQFARRRIRVKPGKEIEGNTNCGRATFYLESDAGNNYEELIGTRWRYIRRRTKRYRELMRSHRLGRQELLEAGLLHAITGARPEVEIFQNESFSVAMPSDSLEARTGWVRIIRLDHMGQPTGHEVIARVNDYGPGLQARRCGVIIDMTKAVAEGLGLIWGKDFGVTGYMNNIGYLLVKDGPNGKTSRYLRVRVEAISPDFLAKLSTPYQMNDQSGMFNESVP